MNRDYMKASFLLLIFILFFLSPQASASNLEDAKKLLEKANNALQAKNFLEALRYSDKAFKAAEEDELKAEALYLYGKIAEKAAYHLTEIAWKEVKPRKDGGYWDDDFINWAGLKPYEEIGLKFKWSHLGQMYYYSGESYREVFQNFPHTKWACPASFKLVLLEREPEWEGHPQGPKKEITKLEVLLKKCMHSEVISEILLKIAKDYMYLRDCYRESRSQFFDLKKAEIYRQKAEETLKKIIKEYPDSEEAQKAKYHLEELKVVRKKRHR